MNIKRLLFLTLLILLSLTMLTSCLTSLLLASSVDSSNSEKATDYLLSKIVPMMDAEAKKEITGYLTKGAANLSRPIAYIAADKSVVITDVLHSFFDLTISPGGDISFSVSFSLKGYSSNDRTTMYLIDGDREIDRIDVTNSISVSTSEISYYTSYFGYYSYTGYLTDFVLPDRWVQSLISFGDKVENTLSIRIDYSGKQFKYNLSEYNGNRLIRIAYLVDSTLKGHKKAMNDFTKFLNSQGTTGRTILSKIKSGILDISIDSGFSIIKADNISFGLNENSQIVSLHAELPAGDVCYINVFCDDVPVWIPDAGQYMKDGCFDYLLNESDLLSYIRSCKSCSIDYYDSDYKFIESKSVLSDIDRLLLGLYSGN